MENNILKAALYFLLSTIITCWFIQQGKLLYFSQSKMLLSGSIAAAKWGIQIVAAYFLLQQKKWDFIAAIAFTCFVGSCILLPYCLFKTIQLWEHSFLISLIVAVLAMIVLYYKGVKDTVVSIKWFFGWLCCLATAIVLQIFVVFKMV